jgi:hypothetical protein
MENVEAPAGVAANPDVNAIAGMSKAAARQIVVPLRM